MTTQLKKHSSMNCVNYSHQDIILLNLIKNQSKIMYKSKNSLIEFFYGFSYHYKTFKM